MLEYALTYSFRVKHRRVPTDLLFCATDQHHSSLHVGLSRNTNVLGNNQDSANPVIYN